MNLRPMTEPELCPWYENELAEAFPENERKPLSDIRRLIDEGRYTLLGLFDGAVMAGYAALWMDPKNRDYVLLDYLAVTASRRNGGLGGALLQEVILRYADESGILLESEVPVPCDPPEENALRERRIAFYQRCGCTPLYEMGTCGLRFITLIGGPAPADLAPAMAAHRRIYGPKRPDAKIPMATHEVPQQPHWMK